jgi:D-alanyl-D-alanine-carboxypeptidase/D-alanyl-D-alanine-endopeptidase
MNWVQAWGLGLLWVAATGLPALALAYWTRRHAPAALPHRLLTLVNGFLCSLPYLVPLLTGWHHGFGTTFLAAAILEVPAGWALYQVLRAPLAAHSLERHLARRSRSAGLPSLSVGIVQQQQLVYAKSFGVADRKHGLAATPDTLYRIGSITKVFTTTLLAMLRDRGTVRLDDPVASYLPPEVKLPGDPRGAPAITLRHLATHSSGLPSLPPNLVPKGEDPYGGYPVDALYAGLPQTRLDFPIGARQSYSNLGMGLLGHVLERAARMPYEEMLEHWIFAPLGMDASTISLSDLQRQRFARGYKENDPRAEAVDWGLGCLSPAGAIASSVTDLARFVALQLRAGQADVTPVSGGTLLEMHMPQRLDDNWEVAVGLGWHIVRDDALGHVVWHNGGLDGYHSYLAFAPRYQVGIVALTNCGRDIDSLGQWLLQEAVKMFGVQVKPEVDPLVGEMAEALAWHVVKEPPDTLAELFHPSFLASIPLEEVRPIFTQMYEQFGPCEGVDVEPGDNPRRGTVRFRFAGGKTRRCEIEIDSAAKARIVYVLFE